MKKLILSVAVLFLAFNAFCNVTINYKTTLSKSKPQTQYNITATFTDPSGKTVTYKTKLVAPNGSATLTGPGKQCTLTVDGTTCPPIPVKDGETVTFSDAIKPGTFCVGK